MEQLIDSLSGGKSDGVGLNIIYEKENLGGPGIIKKPKKRNKYEKRREKARRAKEQKARQKQEQNIPSVSHSDDSNEKIEKTSLQEINDHKKENDVQSGIIKIQSNKIDDGSLEKKHADENVKSVLKSQEVNTPESTSTESVLNDEERDTTKSMIHESEMESKDPTDELNEEKSVSYPNKLSSSSKKNGQSQFENSWPELNRNASTRSKHSITANDLTDEKRRAEYLASYHARPHEIDRRSRAVSTIKPSQASTHLFSTNTPEDIDSICEGEEKTANSSPSCPWKKLGLHERLQRTIRQTFKLERPTIIQANAITSMIAKSGGSRHNLFIQSETGSGKTLAYLLPIVQALAIDAKKNTMKKVDRALGGTRAIILCPTRELASQTAVMAEKLIQNSFSWLVAGCLSGGEKRKSEKSRLRKGISVLIATPGRLLDHLGKTDCLLLALKGKLEWFVLDEADRLLDMGLGNQVEQIVQMVRANQPKSGINKDGITWRSYLVSATVTGRVEDLAKKLLGGSVWLWSRAKQQKENLSKSIESDCGFSNDAENKKLEENTKSSKDFPQTDLLGDSTPQQLAQLHMIVSAKLRLPALISFLVSRVQKKEDTVVFMSTCDGVDFHYALLNAMDSIISNNDQDDVKGGIFGNECFIHKLHGNIPHAQRQTILAKFALTASVPQNGSPRQEKKSTILLATDVAARGLNLPGVDWIVQYDPPCETADYIHRAGRAARAGNAGHALLFLLPSERQYIDILKLRGLENLTAISLAETFKSAAKICTDVTAEGEKRSGGGLNSSLGRSREGEAFTTALQCRLEECIEQDDKDYKDALAKKTESIVKDRVKKRRERRKAKNASGALLEAARTAFSAYIRAYPTKEKAVKHIFSARALHLGHIARSFALKEPPTSVAKTQRTKNESKKENTEEEWLATTGQKRSTRLAFGNKPTALHGTMEGSEQNTPSTAPHQKKSKRRRGNDYDDKSAGKFVSFMDTADSSENGGPFVNDANALNQSKDSTHEKMMKAARRMQGSGMEFF